MVFSKVAYRFRTPSLELKYLETSFGAQKQKFLRTQKGRRVNKGPLLPKGAKILRPYAQQSAKRIGEVRWLPKGAKIYSHEVCFSLFEEK